MAVCNYWQMYTDFMMPGDTLRCGLLCLLCACLPAQAQNDTRIEIHADTMRMDINNGSSEYHGDVLIRKGDIELRGDSVSIRKQAERVEQVRVTGKPAHFRQGDAVQAQSEVMLFDVASNMLTLKIRARLQQRDHLVESALIRFDTERQILLAGAGNTPDKNGKRRVNIILNPDQPVENR